jgi:hypothetical protein
MRAAPPVELVQRPAVEHQLRRPRMEQQQLAHRRLTRYDHGKHTPIPLPLPLVIRSTSFCRFGRGRVIVSRSVWTVWFGYSQIVPGVWTLQ